MKLIGSYTSPFVRKISILLLLKKGHHLSNFVNELPHNADSGWRAINPGNRVKVPAGHRCGRVLVRFADHRGIY